MVPIRTLRNISLNPNFGGEVMVVSLGCEKLQLERLLPPGSIPLVDERQAATDLANALDVVCLQDDAHLGFKSMVDSIVRQAVTHLQRLPPPNRARQRTGGGRAMWRQRCVFRCHGQPGSGVLHRFAGARRGHRGVF